MKLFHLSDLHLGKRLDDFSMIPDQAYILHQIQEEIEKESPDGILIAGDVYDRSVPPTEAVALLDQFLVFLAQKQIPTFIISGNHDSPERLSFAQNILKEAKIYISPLYQGDVKPITLKKEEEEVDIYLLPFLKPVHVKKFFPQEEIISYTDAMDCAIKQMKVDSTRTSILVTHQFVTGAKTSESEELSVGGSDNVDTSVFQDFHYVALGHLHAPQNMGSPRIRYCGTPLKYSFSEANHKKSITVVELEDSLSIREIPLTPKRDLIQLKGDYETLSSKDFTDTQDTQAYLRVTLTDEEEILEGMSCLRVIYPNIMELRYDNKRTRHQSDVDSLEKSPDLQPMELFSKLYQEQNGEEMSQEQQDFVENLIQSIWEEQEL